MDKLKMDEFIARLDLDLEIKFLLEQGLKKAHGNWFTFLHELEMVMVENEDFENAIHVRDTLNKIEEIIQRRK
jgi:protein-arginine kinase activator protein McsA